MVTAAKKMSQAATHMAIAFTIMYLMTDSVAFGGLAALLEPIVNVLLLPLHEQAWQKARRQMGIAQSPYLALAMEKFSQVLMHMTVAFAVMYGATGSVAFGGLAAVLEPICNVILLPFHDRLWNKQEAGMAAPVRVAAV